METDILRFATYLGKSLICFTYQYEINFRQRQRQRGNSGKVFYIFLFPVVWFIGLWFLVYATFNASCSFKILNLWFRLSSYNVRVPIIVLSFPYNKGNFVDPEEKKKLND